ncbi:cell wall-active antibiotics response protein LiaF [Paenibacillus sp. L3-i20]|uniref:cell wall-active antibiotics response protein LiaF n=1 Tax=Paenibacillus sp. L3-i20 TaxID=2905833 RepID=UPI001EDCF736|nr:cell wall-active antibiotics response protein LiaF [Paenibacillus sp. L3-i20]GKU80281.1 hypothetical protein L3i20_v246780 [Paenibacillus sp. L3-i20]
MGGNFANRFFTGSIIITVGVIFLLKQLGILTMEIGEMFSTFWPCILIYSGASQLLMSGRKIGARWLGVVLIFIGGIFLGNNLGLFFWSIGDVIPYLIPFIIIFVGLRMIWRPRSKPQDPPSDEWKSYRPYADESEVPPAPPLHPDPNGISSFHDEDEESEREGSSFTDEFTKSNSYDEDLQQEYGKQKRRKVKQRLDERNKEHVEYWNSNDPSVINRSGFIGDIHMGHDHWELKPINITHFIGDTVLDLTKAQIPFGETKINITSFLGDVKVYVPNDYELGVRVVSNAFMGDVKILGQKEGGIFTSVDTKSPRYKDSDKKIKLIVSTFIGDTRVTKVG